MFLGSSFKEMDMLQRSNIVNYIFQITLGDQLHTKSFNDVELKTKLEDANKKIQFSRAKSKLFIDPEAKRSSRIPDSRSDSPSKDKEGLDPPISILPWSDSIHTFVLVKSKTFGDFEIRIRNYKHLPYFYVKDAVQDYELINLYYQFINKYYLQKCPAFYQYR